jgi:D-3-phosphoglycerate dehydrogenase / 2-oxoglutarate reductase
VAKFKVLLVEDIDHRAVAMLSAVADVSVASGFDPETLLRETRDKHGMIFRAQGEATRKLMEACPSLKVIARHGVGVDNIDIPAATDLGIQVLNTPLANNESVAEQTMGMLLGLSKRIFQADRALRRGDWKARFALTGLEVKGKTLGIVGTGRVGSRLAEMAHHGFGMNILYRDVIQSEKLETELGARRMELDELLAQSDYVSLHVPLLPSTQHLIGKRELALMKPTAYLLNLSRGPVVDEAALVEALQNHTIGGAGLDVYEVEPVLPNNPLLKLDNVVLSPHMASLTSEAVFAMAMVVKDVMAVLESRAPEFPVNHPATLRK